MSDCKEISARLHKALEGAIILDTFPKTTVDVFALVLESGGSKFCILNSTTNLCFLVKYVDLLCEVQYENMSLWSYTNIF